MTNFKHKVALVLLIEGKVAALSTKLQCGLTVNHFPFTDVKNKSKQIARKLAALAYGINITNIIETSTILTGDSVVTYYSAYAGSGATIEDLEQRNISLNGDKCAIALTDPKTNRLIKQLRYPDSTWSKESDIEVLNLIVDNLLTFQVITPNAQTVYNTEILL